MLKRPIRSLPIEALGKSEGRTLTTSLPISIVQMSPQLIHLWNSHAQNWINTRYKYAGTNVNESMVRADVNWNWSHNLRLAQFHTLISKIPGAKSGPALALCIVVSDGEGANFPIGMLTVVPQFFTSIENNERERTFAWYLADAPVELYEGYLEMKPVKGVAKALIDTALQAGFDFGGDGDFLLHADPNGGDKLISFYKERCRMKRLFDGSCRISQWRRFADGEYFSMTPRESEAFCAQYDGRR